jgi:intein/homing endonuclease
MDFRNLSNDEKKRLVEVMFTPLSSKEELRDWVRAFLNLEIPEDSVDPESTSSPLDAIWQIYHTFKTNTGNKNPGYILMSCREGMKCQIKSTICMTNGGFKKIENIEIGDVIWTGFSWQKVAQTFNEGLKPALKVTLEGGHTSTGTPIHRYWCLRDGAEQWITGKDLNEKTDLICLNVNTGLKINNTIYDKENYDIGYFLGILTGDGCLTCMDGINRVGLTTTDAYIADFFQNFVTKYLNDVNIYRYKYELRISSKSEIQKLKQWGLTNSYSWEKQIPSFAYSNYDAMKGFIAGVFDTDGCWDKKGDCFFEMTAGPLLDQIQIALTAFGIESKVRHNKKLYGIQKHLVSRLTISQTESAKLESAGIVFKAKKAQKHKINQIPNCKDTIPIIHTEALLEVCNRHGHIQIRNRKFLKERTDQKKFYNGITTDKLHRLCLWMHENYEHGYVSEEDISIVKKFDKILLNKWKKFTVEDVGEQYFYDLTVENEHSYWSNGLISHNTVSVSILEILLLLHFQLDIGHAAAVETQASVNLQYIEGFMLQIAPILEHSGWVNATQNKRLIKFKTPQGKFPFIKIVICNPKGMNSLHSNALFLDELDLADPKALKEGQNITGYSKGIHGITVYLSTRKYAFGNMAQAIEKADSMNYKILRWNIIDVTERCPETRHLPDLPKEDRYVAKSLPLQQISVEEFGILPDTEKSKWDLVKDAHAGCKTCPLLPVCRKRLSEKKPNSSDGFFKPIDSVIQKFRENDVDIAEAQLMCWKPGSEGLVYPRFNTSVGKGNVITTKEAYEAFVGPTSRTHISEMDLLLELKKADIPIYAGVDWGYTHDSVIIVVAYLPIGEVWVLDCFAAPGLEFVDVLENAKGYRDKYGIQRWFCDQAMPSHILSFNKNGMKSPKFVKDVFGGIESVRSKIVNAAGKRMFKVVDTPGTRKVISAIAKHRFVLDGQGNLTMEPDDERGIADICDALRYIGQNLFPVKGPYKPMSVMTEEDKTGNSQSVEDTERMKDEIAKRLGPGDYRGGTGKKGGFFWDF